jgi:hypothetical protein
LAPGLLASATTLAPAEVAAYRLVVAEDVALADLPLDEVRRVFLLKRTFWKPGRPIRLVLPATGLPARTFMLEHVCQKTEGELRRLVMESVYRGDTDQAPRVAASDDEALKMLSSSPGSVALVSVGTALLPNLKALRIDGKNAGDPGYPLAR